MSFLHLPDLAVDRAAERERDATAWRRAHSAASGRRSAMGVARRRAALAFLAVHRLTAAAVRRLDACIADDLVSAPVAPDGI